MPLKFNLVEKDQALYYNRSMNNLFKREKVTDNLKNIKVKNWEQIYFPYILDKDPVKAASYLTIKDSTLALELLLKAYDSIEARTNEYPILQYCIVWSQSNFEWFVLFTLELIRLVTGEEGEFKFPYEFIQERKFNPLSFFPPLEYKSKRAVVRKFRKEFTNVVDAYRVLYLSHKYDLQDFREGFPAWYTLGSLCVFEEYNPKTNTRVKITFSDGELHYYIAGASDNWQEIYDVPLEMDHIVSALLFRS